MPALLLANPYVDIILALALAWLSLKIVRALFGPLYGIPGIGAAIAKLDHVIARSVSNACGSIASGASLAVGGSLHAIARLIDRSAAQFKRPALAILQSAALVLDTRLAVRALKSLVHRAVGSVGAVLPRVKTLEREYGNLRHRVKTLEREVAHGIGDDVLPRIKSLEREYDHIENGVIPALRDAVGTADSAIDNLYEWAKGKAQLLGVGTFAMAVTAVLATLGLDWLGCRGRKNVNGKTGCALWDEIEGLLGLATVTLIALDFEQLVRQMQAVEEVTVEAIHDALKMV